jgi:osmoprotectant transport system permease protein
MALALLPLAASQNSRGTIMIGAKNFSEQYILASVIETKLRAAGFATQRRDDLGSAVAYRALSAGDIDVYVDYSGTLWANVLGRTDIPPAATMRRALTTELRQRDGVELLGGLGFENAYVLAMRKDKAAALGIQSLDDLAAAAPRLHMASDIEFLSRPEWRSVAARYGIRFAGQKSYNPTFMYRAVADGSADVISAFSSDGRIPALGLTILSDPRGALPSYEAVLLLSPKRAYDPTFIAALRPLIGAIPIDHMQKANLMVDRDTDKSTPAEAARWLVR